MNVRAEKCHRRWVNWVTEKLPAANLQTAQSTFYQTGRESVGTVNAISSDNQGKYSNWLGCGWEERKTHEVVSKNNPNAVMCTSNTDCCSVQEKQRFKLACISAMSEEQLQNQISLFSQLSLHFPNFPLYLFGWAP